jgi:general secretion pathway protein G
MRDVSMRFVRDKAGAAIEGRRGSAARARRWRGLAALTAQRGFTLIELMIVTALIVTLATMGLVQYRQSVVRSKEAVLKEDLFRMRDALDQYYADKNQYPGTLEDLVSGGYLRAIPKDPFTDSESTWQTVPPEPDPNNLTVESGVYDVKSGSDATALDGTRYAEW